MDATWVLYYWKQATWTVGGLPFSECFVPMVWPKSRPTPGAIPDGQLKWLQSDPEN
ncbi:hypothetical protein M404DRAFT_993369 [Pisolithus tinctorius Marx 270]|uniref:Uncharacterized protein n=1 Tax=Pisolithus tinctorius Marx 270 TaxID=870435 RepID=A0A0C3KSB3_PISTI|nr:hypothetical protein M404DRAFT_993369 [Pisolithus tinctorius Marx 270]